MGLWDVEDDVEDILDDDFIKEESNRYLTNSKEALSLIGKIISLSKEGSLSRRTLQKLDDMLDVDFLAVFKQIQLNNEAQLQMQLVSLSDKLLEQRQYEVLKNKPIIGIGGKFSAGKSKFINSILKAGEELLPEDQNPTTSIPTYIVYGDLEEISAYTTDNKKVLLDSINNIIRLYSFLDREKSSEHYKLKIGLMYCKLREYARAYSLLKDIDNPEAQYECAKMYQYGCGVAKDLEMAKKHYKRIKIDYKDTYFQYDKVCKMLIEETEKKENFGYNESRSYSSTSSYSSSTSSDYCFITTAACIALNKSKDCEELNEMRRFRDLQILGDGIDGNELVEEYYRIGPLIVKLIDAEWNPYAIYYELWQDYICPSYDMIKNNEYEVAKQGYIEMVKALCEKYGVRIKEHIMKKYSIKIG